MSSSSQQHPPEEEVSTEVANLSSPWEFDTAQPYCAECAAPFSNFNRRHHCRLCGKIFCHDCSCQRALIPPSSIVLVPKGGKKAIPHNHSTEISFNPDDDPDRMLTYCDDKQDLLYGKGLEERTKLAREPLRVCRQCHAQLQSVQEELRNSNSNAMRYNHIDPTDIKRLFNSPLAFTLGHEIRKAAYTLNNLLPLPKRMGALVSSTSDFSSFDKHQACSKEACSAVSPNLGDLDGVRIPARLLEKAQGVAVLTVVKGGFGLAGFEFGTGLVVARLPGEGEERWTAPSAIGTAGISWGALIGAQVSDHVFLLMNDAAVRLMFSNDGSVQLGADVGVALGPLGRSVEADFGASPSSMAPIYTYSLSKGLYAGVSLDGKVIVTRHNVNEKFYGRKVSGEELLGGNIPTPPAAQPLYDALKRCRVYSRRSESPTARRLSQQTHEMSYEYGRDFTVPEPFLHPQGEPLRLLQPPAAADQHSYTSSTEQQQQQLVQEEQQRQQQLFKEEQQQKQSSNDYVASPTIADLSGARPY